MPAIPQLTSSPPIDVNGVPAAIWTGDHGDEGGIIETMTERGLEVTVYFMIRWEYRIAFVQALRGAAGITPGGDGGYRVVRTDPWSLPVNTTDLLPDLPPYNTIGASPSYNWQNYICVGLDSFMPKKPRTDPDGTVTGLTGWIYYEYVVIPARFAVTPYQYFDNNNVYDIGFDLSGFPYTSVKARASGEVFQTDYQTYSFRTNGETTPNGIGIIRPRQEFTITRYMMPFVDTSGYDNLIGKVNQDELFIGNKRYPAQSLLYNGYDPEWIPDASTGYLFCNIHHTLLANGPVRTGEDTSSSSWNVAMRRDGRFDELVLSSDGVTNPFKEEIFKPVIWPEINT